jgi:hypothetical protein
MKKLNVEVEIETNERLIHLHDMTVVIATAFKEGRVAYASSAVYKYDFQGTLADWERVVDAFPDLFIEGGVLSH